MFARTAMPPPLFPPGVDFTSDTPESEGSFTPTPASLPPGPSATDNSQLSSPVSDTVPDELDLVASSAPVGLDFLAGFVKAFFCSGKVVP